MSLILLPAIPLLVLIFILLAYGTTVRTGKHRLSLGFCTYSADQIREFDFRVMPDYYRPPRYSFRMRWRVTVEVFHDSKQIRTHYLAVPNKKSAKKLADRIEQHLQNVKRAAI